VTYVYTQQCDQSSDVARFECCWRPAVQQSNLTGFRDVNVPYCYYPSDFPTYEVTSNETTDFGQRINIVKSQTTYMPNDILKLTVDLIYETQQRFRIKIYDPLNKRYEVPLQVPVVEKKADMTDYEVVVKSKPFSLLVTRKSTGATL
jgi:hypothetical protein